MVVGIDLVRIAQMSESMALFGARFLGRIFTDGELADCARTRGQGDDRAFALPHAYAARLAARFAAKEAMRKVLRPEADEGLGWRAIEIRRAQSGAPEVVLHDGARDLARRRGLGAFTLSLTHETEYASAVVIGERGERPTHGAFARFPARHRRAPGFSFRSRHKGLAP